MKVNLLQIDSLHQTSAHSELVFEPFVAGTVAHTELVFEPVLEL